MVESVVIEPARAEQLEEAFRLLFRQTTEDERDRRVASALELVERGELQSAGVFVASAGRQLLGAIVCLPVPGASGLVWPPQVLPGPQQRAVEDQLVQRSSDFLRQRGAKLGQALLRADEAELAAPLVRNGYAHVTCLWYLSHRLELTAATLSAADHLEFQPYQPADPGEFHATLLASYEGTRDCPEVNGVRTLDEILEGHRAQGAYDPGRWWLAREGGRAVGVLLCTVVPELGGWDLSYVGVRPEARRRGLGRQLVAKALVEARAADALQLNLTVDARNQPAWNLYRRLGFEPFDQRDVYLALWRAGPS
jgi:mycothiol synthase